MKKIFGIFIVIICIFTLEGCSIKPGAEKMEVGLQFAYDLSERAKEYGETLLSERLAEQNIENYKIDLTACGFTTDDPPTFFTAFQYSHGNETEIYGYKFQLNAKMFQEASEKNATISNDQTFTLKKEGIEVAELFLLD